MLLKCDLEKKRNILRISSHFDLKASQISLNLFERSKLSFPHLIN